LKLIGRTQGAGYLVDLSFQEMSHLMGFMTYSELAKSEEGKKLAIGDEIKLHDMFMQLKFYAAYGAELASTASKLQEIANQITLINPIVHVQDQIQEVTND